MNDMISVFNRLTESKLADYNLFEKLISLHFEKFRFFYYIIEDISLTKVQKIECSETTSKLLVIIKFKTNIERDKFERSLKKTNSFYSKYFNTEFETEKNKLNISIENKKIRREEEIYEN